MTWKRLWLRRCRPANTRRRSGERTTPSGLVSSRSTFFNNNQKAHDDAARSCVGARAEKVARMNAYPIDPVGFIRSTVKGREDAPRQGPEGAPDAWLEIEPRFADALLGMQVGHELILITWLHEAKRDVLKNHPRGDERRPLTGVFYTRSPARPNPLGLHPVTVREIEGTRLKIGPIEVFDGTPVVDIKSASTRADG